MAKVVGFGELMVRLNPPGYLRFLQADRFLVNYTGAEANVCVALALCGHETFFVSKLPQNAIADTALSQLHRFCVNTDFVLRGGERMGLYYLEKGASQRPSRIVYDRKYSAVSNLENGELDWPSILTGKNALHFTGITVAIGENLPSECEKACRAAKREGALIFCDLNYRKNLWTSERASAVMRQIVPYVDVLVANEEDAEKVLGIRAEDTDVNAGKLNEEGYVEVARRICGEYGVGSVAVSLRRSITSSDNEWSAMLYTGGQAYFSRKYGIHLVDRVGGGDSFAAGLIHGFLSGYDPQKTVEFAAAASCLKQTMEQDFNLSTVLEIEMLMVGDSSGRVQR